MNTAPSCKENKEMIERGVCPHCLAQIPFSEGWAYCAQCSALYCTDEEAKVATNVVQRIYKV